MGRQRSLGASEALRRGPWVGAGASGSAEPGAPALRLRPGSRGQSFRIPGGFRVAPGLFSGHLRRGTEMAGRELAGTGGLGRLPRAAETRFLRHDACKKQGPSRAGDSLPTAGLGGA